MAFEISLGSQCVVHILSPFSARPPAMYVSACIDFCRIELESVIEHLPYCKSF